MIVWVVAFLVAAGIGFGVAALTYEPPDPDMGQTGPAPAVSPGAPPEQEASADPGLVTVSPARR